MRKYSSILFFLMLTMLSAGQGKLPKVSLISSPKTFVAGSEITLSFVCETPEIPQLFVHDSYGSSLIQGEKKDQQIRFSFPEAFCKRTGVVDWVLVRKKEKPEKGKIEILPKSSSTTKIESYFGPRQIQAGNDYSMLVVMPTDALGNPLPENTPVTIQSYFQGVARSKEIKTGHLMAWQNIPAHEKSGYILVSSTCNGINSNELVTLVYPSNAVNFTISYTRNHPYADGNQLTELTTSGIKDQFGNAVSDGTVVLFDISDHTGYKLKTYGSTIKGVATAEMLHPDRPSTWKVKAFVTGLAESNVIEISYEAALKDFDVNFSEGNRRITIGPLQSFMNQLIPDGARVRLQIFQENKLLEIKSEYSSKGFVNFYLSPEYYKGRQYSFRIETMGMVKNIKTKSYGDGNQ